MRDDFHFYLYGKSQFLMGKQSINGPSIPYLSIYIYISMLPEDRMFGSGRRNLHHLWRSANISWNRVVFNGPSMGQELGAGCPQTKMRSTKTKSIVAREKHPTNNKSKSLLPPIHIIRFSMFPLFVVFWFHSAGSRNPTWLQKIRLLRS